MSPTDKILKILDIRNSIDRKILIKLKGDFCRFRYTRRTSLGQAYEEYDPRELDAKLGKFLRKTLA